MSLRTHRAAFKGQLTPEHQAFPTFGAIIKHDTSLKDVIDPGFWFTQSKTLEAGARVRCEWEDGSRSALLRVMGVDVAAKEVLVAIEQSAEFPTPEAPAGYSFEFVNKAVGWRIIEEGRRNPRRSGFATAHAAAHWLMGDKGAPATVESAPSDEGGKSGDKAGGGKPSKPGKPAKPETEAAAPV